MYRIVVTNIISPDNFDAQIGNDESFKYFKQLEEHCKEFAESRIDSKVDLESLEEGQWVIGYSQQLGKWTRAQINMMTEDDCEVDVKFVDYAITELLSTENIKAPVPEWVYETRPMTVKCKLSGIKPLTRNWISRATKFFSDKVLFKELSVEVLTPDVVPPAAHEVDIIVQINFAFKSISNMMKDEGLAMDTEPADRIMVPQPVKETENRNSPAIPQFDITQLKMKPVSKESSTKAEEERKPDFEELLFTKGLGGESYEQHLDTKMTSMDPEVDSHFTPINISEQLKEMKQANEKPERGIKFRGKGPHSPLAGSRERRRSGEKRSGVGRGIPPHNSPTLIRDNKDNVSPHQSSLRQKSASPANRMSKMQDSPKRAQGREFGKGTDSQRQISLIIGDKHMKESEWRLDQFHFKLQQIWDKYTEKRITLADAAESLKKLLHPVNLTLSDFGGKGELESGLDCLCVKGIEGKDKCRRLAVELIETLKGEDKFNMVMSELLWKLQSDYVTLKRTSRGNNIEGYCKLLAKLFLAGQHWDDNSSINSCAVNTLEKWTKAFSAGGYSRPGGPNRPQLELYAKCLTHFLTEDGLLIENTMKDQIEHLFSVIERRIQDKDLTRTTTHKLSDLITIRNGGTWKKPEEQVLLDMIDKQKFKKKPQNSAEEGERPPKPIRHAELQSEKEVSTNLRQVEQKEETHNAEVQEPNLGSGDFCENDNRRKGRIQIYERVLRSPDLMQDGLKIQRLTKTYTDKCVQTDSVTEVSPSTCSSCSFRSKKQDKFHRVKTMLYDLELEDFFPIFVENGIRDSVLDLEFSEVKELLKECNVKAGQILEIKAYLKKQNELGISRSDQSSSPSIYSDTVDSVALLNQPVSGAQTVGHISTEPPPGFKPIYKTTTRQMDYQDLTLEKALFSPQDFEMSNVPQHRAMYHCNESRYNSYDRQHNIQVSNLNTMANAAAKLPRIDTNDISNIVTCDTVTTENNNYKDELERYYCESPVDNFVSVEDDNIRQTKISPHEPPDSKKNRKEISNSLESLEAKHPRTKYNMTGIKNLVGGWLGPTNDAQKTDNFGHEQNDLSGKYKERTYKNSSVNYNISSTDTYRNSTRSNIRSPPQGDSARSDKGISDAVSPSSYLPPSPGNGPISMDEFPSLAEAKVFKTDTTDNHPALREGPKELTYMEKYRAAKQIPNPEVVNERVIQFGSQGPMCSFCGNRGGHLSHECPDKDKYMFF